jgi:hypothetical protein
MKEIRNIRNIITILLMALMMVSGAALCVLANDGTTDGNTGDVVGNENAGTVSEDVNIEEEEKEEVVDVDVEDVDIDDEDIDVDNEDIDVNDDSEDELIDDNDTNSLHEDEKEGFGVIEPEAVDEDFGQVGEASWCVPKAGGTMYYVQNKDDSISSWFEPYDSDEGVLGPAGYYDPTTKKYTHIYPDGKIITYYDDEDSSNSAASVSYSDTYVPLTAEAKPVEENANAAEEIITSVAEDYTAVLGDYEEPTSNNSPLAAGLALFSGTVVALGVLWKLGLVAFL